MSELGQRFTGRVVNELVKQLEISHKDALIILNNSSFPKLIEDDPEYVMHYSTKYWVKMIKEQQGIEKTQNEGVFEGFFNSLPFVMIVWAVIIWGIIKLYN